MLNAPGCLHDSLIASNGRLYDKLQSIYDTTGGIAVVDAAFLKKHRPFMIRSGKFKPSESLLQMIIHRQATSLR